MDDVHRRYHLQSPQPTMPPWNRFVSNNAWLITKNGKTKQQKLSHHCRLSSFSVSFVIVLVAYSRFSSILYLFFRHFLRCSLGGGGVSLFNFFTLCATFISRLMPFCSEKTLKTRNGGIVCEVRVHFSNSSEIEETRAANYSFARNYGHRTVFNAGYDEMREESHWRSVCIGQTKIV